MVNKSTKYLFSFAPIYLSGLRKNSAQIPRSKLRGASLLFWPLAIGSIFYLLPSQALAACSDDIGLCNAAGGLIPTGVPTPVAILGTVIRLILGVVGVIFFIMILYAGYNWMTAAGSEEKIRSSKRTIANAAIALAIILGSYIVVNLVLTNLQRAMQ